jgi:hypothetical protein
VRDHQHEAGGVGARADQLGAALQEAPDALAERELTGGGHLLHQAQVAAVAHADGLNVAQLEQRHALRGAAVAEQAAAVAAMVPAARHALEPPVLRPADRD